MKGSILAFAFLLTIVSSLEFVPPLEYTYAIEYLSHFGYIDPSVRDPVKSNLMSPDIFKNALKQFQTFAGIEVSGKLDSNTIAVMRSPRCGVKDRFSDAYGSRGKRYAFPGDRWGVSPTNPNKELCSGNSIDTMFNSAEGITYVFKGNKYWRLTDDGVAAGYPRAIEATWPGLPGNIDAAFTYKNGKTYFFKGSQYWQYVGNKMDGENPMKISEGFPGAPDNMDAAMVWSGNGKIYFFKGAKFWRFDPTQKPPIKSNYPKPISNWEGVPNNLDAVLQYTNGYTYFFKNSSYYRFNDRSFSVDSSDPPYPRTVGYWWFGCEEETK